jgi:hypothetical protein
MHFLTANRGSYDPRSIPYTFPNVAVPSHLSIPGTILLARQVMRFGTIGTKSLD